MASGDNSATLGRRAAIVMAATGVFWIAVTWIGGELGWTNRTRALFDLVALAGFGAGLWIAFQAWRARDED